jgi:hypothetical protein
MGAVSSFSTNVHGDFCKVRFFGWLDILLAPTPRTLIGWETNRADSIDVASVRPHEDPERSGSQAERNADKQRLLLLIYWSRTAPKVIASGPFYITGNVGVMSEWLWTDAVQEADPLSLFRMMGHGSPNSLWSRPSRNSVH